MKKLLVIIAVGLCVCYVILQVLKSVPASLNGSTASGLEWEDCWFPTPLLPAVHCGFLRPDEESQIPVVVIRRSLFRRDLKPLLYLPGGPGEATILPWGTIGGWVAWLEGLQIDRDLVLVEYLGTGQSRPKYHCPQFINVADRVLGKSLTSEEEAKIYDRIAWQCYKALAERRRDLSRFTLPYRVQNISRLIEALPDAEWDVYGVSYGTRVALSLMRDPPANLRKIVLDGVYPLDVDGFKETPGLVAGALHKLFLGCKRQRSCNDEFPDLEQKFYQLVGRLQKSPLRFTIHHPYTRKELPVLVNGHRLISLVFQSMYRWDLLRHLPHAVWSAAEGDTRPLQPIVESFSWHYFEDTWNDVVSISSACSERRAEVTTEVLMQESNAYPQLREYLRAMWMFDVCSYWGVPKVPQSYLEPVDSEIPTLLLSGSYDPITPAAWARRAKKHLPRSYSFEFPRVGHAAIGSDRCAETVMREFLREKSDMSTVSCINAERGPAFTTPEA